MSRNVKIKIFAIASSFCMRIRDIGLRNPPRLVGSNWNHNIHLGLTSARQPACAAGADSDAFKAEATPVIQRMKEFLNKGGVQFAR